MSRNTPAARWATVAAVLLLAPVAAPLVSPSPAWAMPGLHLVTAQGYGSSDNKGLTAQCPTQQAVIGGGAKVTGPGQAFVHLGTLQPQEATRSFGVMAWEVEPGTDLSWSITAFAICIDRPTFLYYMYEDTLSMASSEPRQSVQAQCPRGSYVIGMGAFVTGGGQVLLQSLHGQGNTGVTASATEDFNGYSSSWGIGVWAVCTPFHVKSPNLPNDVWEPTGIPDGEDAKSELVLCPPGRYVHGAGFRLHGVAGTEGRLLLTDLIPSSDNLAVVAAAGEAPTATTNLAWGVDAHAMCTP